MSFPTTSPPAFLHPSLCCFLTCAVPYSLPSCPAIPSQKCCLKCSRKQSRDIPSAQSRAQGHLQAPCQSFHCSPPWGQQILPLMAGSCPSPLYPSLCTRKTMQCSTVQQPGHGAPPQTLPLHHRTGVQAQRTVQPHPKSLPAKTNKPCDF